MYEITFRNLDTGSKHTLCVDIDKFNLFDSCQFMMANYGNVIIESFLVKESRFID